MSTTSYVFYKDETIDERYPGLDAGLKLKLQTTLNGLVAMSIKYPSASSFKTKFVYSGITYTVTYYPSVRPV